MRFLNLFRPKPKAVNITFMTEIRVGTSVQRTDLIIDLRPFAAEVLADFPDPIAIDVDALASLAAKAYNGSHIKVAAYPPGIDRTILKKLIGHTIVWSRWPTKYDGMVRANRALPYYQLRVGPQACPAALALASDIIPLDQVTRTPMDNCWNCACQCWYKSLTDRQAAELITRR
jgi:hypothetical protein